MGMTCKTCKRDDLAAINEQLVKGVSLRTIANQIGDEDHLRLLRHKNNCIADLFEKDREKRREGLLKDVDDVREEIKELKTDFPDNPNVRVGIVGKMLDVIEKEAKLTGAFIKDGENPADTQASLDKARQWVNLRELLDDIYRNGCKPGEKGAPMPSEAEIRAELARFDTKMSVDEMYRAVVGERMISEVVQ